MSHWLRLLTVSFFLLFVASRESGDVYAKDPHVYELTPSNFDKVVHRSNYTSIVKFYAPWCGYCKQLSPFWHKLGKFMHKDGKYGVHVAAVNCDREINKQLCASYRVQGFPTLIVFRPPKYSPGKASAKSRHVPEPYTGQRTLKPMADFVSSRIKNYVSRIHKLEGISKFFQSEGPRVLLISKSHNISPVYKTMAIDFLSTVNFGFYHMDSASAISTTINGEEVALPIEEGDKLPILVYWDPKTSSFVKFNKGKLSDKHAMESWVMEVTGIKPTEGGLSKKDKKYYSKYRGEKKVEEHDEL